MQAQDVIHRGDFDPCDYKAVYDLFKVAYGDEEKARKAQSQAAELYANREMERAKRK
jgi:hypothetical protein